MSNEWWWRRRFMGKKSMPKNIKWKHDNWTLHRIYEKVSQKKQALRARILLALIHLQAGISVEQITKMIGESRTNIVGWVRRYNKEGLQVLLGVQVAVPIHFRRRIEKYVRQNPNVLGQLERLETEDDFEMYAEEMDVEGYALRNWVYELELGGSDARKTALGQ